MLFNTFKDFCEQAGKTVYTPPTVNTGFSHKGNKSFEQAIEPLLDEFLKKVLVEVLDKYNTQLSQPQVNYILDKLKNKLSTLQYDAKKDLSSIINDIFMKGQLAHSTVKQLKT
jgi:predicted aldo/keto reductase-like oxidoreductase